MAILKLSRIKLIPIFIVAFCIAITSCTQKEILLEVIELSTEILDLKTTDDSGEIVEKASCGNFRNACYTKLGNVKVYFD